MRMNRKTLLLVTPLLAASLLLTTACSTKRVKPMQKEVDSTNEEASKLLQKLERTAETKPSRPLSENIDGIWLPVRKAREGELQSAAYKVANRRLSVNREFRTLREVAERVTLLMGIPVTIAPEALPEEQNTSAAQQPAASPQVPLGMPGMNPMAFMANSIQNAVPLSYDGPLSGFLDVAAARFGVHWEWNGDGIRFYRFATRTFRLMALPGETTMTNMVSNTTGGNSSGGSSGSGSTGNSASSETKQKIQVDSKLSVWDGILESIKGMLSKKGASVSVTAATGTVTVTDTPEVLARVEKYIEQQNASLSKQVVVNVRVLSVELKNSEQYGINWDIVYRSLAGNAGFSFKNAFDPSSTNNPTLTLNVLSSAGRVNQNPNGPLTGASIGSWAGSQAFINALSTQGHVSQVTSASLTTLNNQSAPLQVGRQTTYLASSTTTQTSGVGSTTTLQPGTLTTGFSMSIVPHILDRGQLMLQFAVDISSLLGIYSVNSNNSTIQAPDVDTRNFMQRVLLHSGDTLVMTGFEQSASDADTRGVGNARNPTLGGGVKGNRNRSVLVILIQPVTTD